MGITQLKDLKRGWRWGCGGVTRAGRERTQAGSAPLAGAAGGKGGRHYPLALLILEGSVPWW